MCKIIVVATPKGGVDKTAMCQNLSYALTEKGYKVIAVDFDPQMNLTTFLMLLKVENCLPIMRIVS